jgi:hypothetical protein
VYPCYTHHHHTTNTTSTTVGQNIHHHKHTTLQLSMNTMATTNTSSCTHIVLDIHICSMLKEADDPFEMFIPTGIVKRSVFPLHPPPPYNKHNINYC